MYIYIYICIYIHICIFTYIHTYIFIYIHIYTNTHTQSVLYICRYTLIHTLSTSCFRMHIHIYVYLFIYVYAHIIYVCIYKNTYLLHQLLPYAKGSSQRVSTFAVTRISQKRTLPIPTSFPRPPRDRT